jgi:hypothetical protein
MAGFIEGVDRDQSTLFPATLDDYIGGDTFSVTADFLHSLHHDLTSRLSRHAIMRKVAAEALRRW